MSRLIQCVAFEENSPRAKITLAAEALRLLMPLQLGQHSDNKPSTLLTSLYYISFKDINIDGLRIKDENKLVNSEERERC